MRYFKRIAALFSAILLAITSLAFSANAAAKPATGVKLSAKTLTVGVGERKKVTAALTPKGSSGKKITWKRFNKNVKVDSKGYITGVKKGKATVTAASGKLSASLKVTVKPKPKSLTLSKKMSLSVGQTKTPKVTMVPSDAQTTRTWKSSNPSIASIDKKTGKITPKKTGTVTITATSYNKVKSNKLTLTVKPKPAPKKIESTKKSITIGVKQSFKPTLKFTPSYASKSVTYSSTAPKIATVSSKGEIKGVKKGKATVKVISKKNKEILAKITVNVRSAPTSVKFNKKTSSSSPLQLGMGDKTKYTPTVTINSLSSTDRKGLVGIHEFSSSDTKKLKVDKKTGKITLVSPGTAKVIVETWNGKKGTLYVKVNPAPETVRFKYPNVMILAGKQFSLNTVTITPSNAHNVKKYYSADSKIASVNASTGTVTGVKAGTTKIWVEMYNGKKTSFNITVAANANAANFTATVNKINTATQAVNTGRAGYKVAKTQTTRGAFVFPSAFMEAMAVSLMPNDVKDLYYKYKAGITDKANDTVAKGQLSNALPATTLRPTDITAITSEKVGNDTKYTYFVVNQSKINSSSAINRFMPELIDIESEKIEAEKNFGSFSKFNSRTQNTSINATLNSAGKLTALQYLGEVVMEAEITENGLTIKFNQYSKLNYSYTSFAY